jgi:hypothetical protein
MKKGNNEGIFDEGMPSIRLKYKGAHGGKSKTNNEVIKETTKREISSGGKSKGVIEEKIVIKKESTSSRIVEGSPSESTSKITTKTVIQGGEGAKSRQQITITKTETTEKSQNSRPRSGQKGKELVISKTIEINSSSNNNRNGSQGRKIKEETTTKTTTTTTTNQGTRGDNTVTNTTTESTNTQRKVRRGKEEITTKTTTNTTTTNQRSGSQAKSSQKEEMTTTKTSTTNQRQSSRGQNQGPQIVKEVTTETSVNRRNQPGQKQVTKTKEITTAQTEQIKISENVGRSGLRSGQNTNQRSLVAQKSTPALRASKEVTSQSSKEEKEKRPSSSKTEYNTNRENIIRITINDTGKIPKKTYVLNVRKLDRIQQDRRQRLTYSSNLEEKNPISTNFNHNIIVINNVKREFPYYPRSNSPNIIQKVINESGKIQKKQVVISPRKNEIIKSFRKPFKLTYENYVESNSSMNTGINKIPLPTTSKNIKANLKSKANIGEQKSSLTTETRTSRVRIGGNEQTTKTTTTTTTETKTRIGKTKSEANMIRGGESGSKVTITKTEISTESQGGKPGRLQISRSGRNISGNSGTTTEQKTTKVRESSRGGNKVETVTKKEVVTQRTGKKGGLEAGKSSSKITTVKKTEISVSSQDGNDSGKGKSRVKKETSSTTTTTTTKTVTKTSSSKEEPVGGGGVIKKFRSMRKMKK